MKTILKYLSKDVSNWFRSGRYRPKTGYIDCYCSALGKPFGSGKTVSAINRINDLLVKYDGKHGTHITVWSNIDIYLHCDFRKINNLQTFVDGIEFEKAANHFNVLFIDELSAEFNNRNFSKNFTPDFLAKLVTCRHYNTLIIYTAQNYYMVDKVFRDLTTHVFTCSKFWRFFFHRQYLPQDMEMLTNAQYVAPVRRSHFFADDDIFSRYDTFASFKAMDKAIKDGEYKSAKEISECYVNNSTYLPNVRRKQRDRISVGP